VDEDPEERQLGIEAGFAWRQFAKRTVVYADLGVTDGMRQGIAHANASGCEVEIRVLGTEWEP
jgi:hypothetical protein